MRRHTKNIMLVMIILFTVSFTMAQNTSLVNESPATQNLINQQQLLERLGGNQIVDVTPNLIAPNVTPTDETWDLQLSFDVEAATGALGNVGAECDGNYFYTTRWETNLIHKYDLDGNLMEEFSVPGVSGLRDLAFDGTYMYGGAASTTIYQIDFNSQSLVSSISSTQLVRSISFDDGQNGFWCSDWDTDLTLVSMSGTTLATIPAATHGLSGMYGSAYDEYTSGGPFLMVFDQGAGPGTAQIIHQMDLATLTPTGVTYDVMNDLEPNAQAICGGLFIVDGIYAGLASIGGLLQGTPDVFFVYELIEIPPPLTNDVGVLTIPAPSSGMVLGDAEPVTVAIKNFGTAAQSNFDVDFTLDGGDPVTETISATINGGETYNHTFATTVDLSALGDYEFTACTYLAGDENTANDCKNKTVSNLLPEYCDATTTNEDEWIMDVVCGDIQNIGTGWQGGVADYTDQYTTIYTGSSEDITVENGNAFAVDIVYCWVDWNMNYQWEQGGDEEFMLTNVGGTGQTFTGAITVPAGTPNGLYRMRVRMTYSIAPVPCGNASFGEVEDYSIMVVQPILGSLDGTVTAVGGDPIEDATVMLQGTSYSATTNESGYYLFEAVPVGDYTIECSATGYNTETADVTIVEAVTITQDFELIAPEVVVDPLTIEETLEPNTMTDVTVNISNPGSGSVDWSAVVFIESDNGTDEMFDLQFSWPVGVGGGEAGIETDGNYIYTTKWNGANFYRYDMDGTYIETFTCGSASDVRDLAFNGTYFYGSAASTTVFEMDFDAQTVVSSFSAPAAIRAIAYNEDEDLFYGNNWSEDIQVFDPSGASLDSFAVGPFAASLYGLAYDNYTGDGQFLWAYSQVGTVPTDQNWLVQIELPSGNETGLTFDVATLITPTTGSAGGLCIDDHLVPGTWTIMGNMQNEFIWGLELVEMDLWLSIDINGGSLAFGEDQDINVHLDATDLLPAFYVGQVQFTTNPNVGSPVVDVTLNVSGLIPPINLDGDYDCTDVELTWEMPSGGNPDSWNVYRDDVPIGTSTSMDYTDEMVDPEVEYSYKVAAVYSGDESQSTAPFLITVPTPEDLGILNLVGEADIPNENDVTLTWDLPAACVAPDSYSIYRNGSMIASGITELTYVDAGLVADSYEYYVVAVYYFGESDPSDLVNVLITGIENYDASMFQIFPNPATDIVNVKTPIDMTSIRVLNNLGQVVVDEVLNTQIFQIDVSQFESGIYYIKLDTDDGSIVKKIAIE